MKRGFHTQVSGVRRSEARTRASTGGNGQKKPTESAWFLNSGGGRLTKRFVDFQD